MRGGEELIVGAVDLTRVDHEHVAQAQVEFHVRVVVEMELRVDLVEFELAQAFRNLLAFRTKKIQSSIKIIYFIN